MGQNTSQKEKIAWMLEKYSKYKDKALCIDVECTYWNGPISVIGIYKPQEGEIKCDSYIKGKNLTKENLTKAFAGVKMLLTYSGLKFDVPKIRKDFPGVIPDDVFVLDVYLLAKGLGYGASLKTVENTLGIERPEYLDNKRRISTKLWKKYEKYNDEEALKMLVEYNRQDTINLYPIVEQLINTANKM